jgi:hypothetical protein
VKILSRSDNQASRAAEAVARNAPDWQSIGDSIRAFWQSQAPDVNVDTKKLRKLADEQIARPMAELPNTISTTAPQIAGSALAALPQALDSLSAALRNLPDAIGDVPAAIDSIQRRRRQPLWRRQGPLFAVLGIGLLGGIVAGLWMATTSGAFASIRSSLDQARRRVGNGLSPAGTPGSMGRTARDNATPGSAYPSADAAYATTANGLPSYDADRTPRHAGQGPGGEPSLPADAARGAVDPDATVETENSESWVSVGPDRAKTQPDVTERAIRG